MKNTQKIKSKTAYTYILLTMLLFTIGCGEKEAVVDSENEGVSKEFYGEWVITEYLGKSVPYHEEVAVQTEEGVESEINTEQYLGKQIIINQESVESICPPTELGYSYETWDDLFFVFRNSSDLILKPPFQCADIQIKEIDEEFSIIIDSEAKAVLYVQGEFYNIERKELLSVMSADEYYIECQP